MPNHKSLQAVMMTISILLVILLLALVAPSLHFYLLAPTEYAVVHLLIELFSVVISLLLFSVVWQAQNRELPDAVIIVASCFLMVALFDLFHILSYPGMPNFFTPNSTTKAIDFWLLARFAAASSLLVVVLYPTHTHICRLCSRLWLTTFIPLLLVIGLGWLVIFHPEVIPETFVEGRGLTDFKIVCEYLLVVLYLLTTILLWRKIDNQMPFHAVWLFGAASCAAMSELFFTLYSNASDIYNLTGHLYKVLAYLMLYRALFLAVIERPYQELKASNQKIETLLVSMPEVLIDLHANGRFGNSMHGGNIEELNSLAGKMISDALPPEAVRSLKKTMQRLQETGLHNWNGSFYLDSATKIGRRCIHYSMTRKVTEAEEDHRGYLLLMRDTTAQMLEELLHDLHERRAHALLALHERDDGIDEQEFMQYGIDLIEEITSSHIAFIHLVHSDQQNIELITWSHSTLAHYCSAAFDSHYPAAQAGIWAEALRQRIPMVFNDYASAIGKRGLPEGHSHLERLISLPVLDDGLVRMIVGVGNKDEDYTDEDVKSVQLIANSIWQCVQRRRSQVLKRHSDAVFRATFYQAAVGIARVDCDGRWLEINQKLCDITGYSREELLLLTFQDVTYPDDLDTDLHYVTQMLTGKIQTYSMDKRYIHKTGAIVWINLTVALVHKADGSPDYFIAIINDIQGRVQAENELRESEQLLLESQMLAHLGSYQLMVPSGMWRSSPALDQILGGCPRMASLLRKIGDWLDSPPIFVK